MKSILVTTREEKQKAVDRLIELGFESHLFSHLLTHQRNLYISYDVNNWWWTPIDSDYVTTNTNPVGWKEFLGDSTPRFGGEEKFTVKEIRNYLIRKTSMRDVFNNLTAENIKTANQ